MDKDFILKANLFEQGIKVSAGAKKVLDSLSYIWLMDDYITCSGVTLHYNNCYATIGVDLNSKYELIEKDGSLFISDGESAIKTLVIAPPEYMKDELIVDGKKITEYVNTYTDRVRIQLMSGCANKCKFCNATEFPYAFNKIAGLEKALAIALSQSKIRHVLISTNSPKIEDIEKPTKMYEYFGKKYPRLNLDIMMTPRGFTSHTDSTQYLPYLMHLKSVGIIGLSTNMELHSPEYLKKFCPEKAVIGQANYLKFIKYAVEVFGKNNVRSLLVVGIEPLEETLKGVEKLAQIGCNPVLSPLYPYGEANVKPTAKLFIEAKEKSEQICKQYNIEIGPLCVPCSHNTL